MGQDAEKYFPVALGNINYWTFKKLSCNPSDIQDELVLGKNRGGIRWPVVTQTAGGVIADGRDMPGAICRLRARWEPPALSPYDAIPNLVVAQLTVWESLQYERATTTATELKARRRLRKRKRRREEGEKPGAAWGLTGKEGKPGKHTFKPLA